MRFKPFSPALDGLEMNRVYRTDMGHEVGPFDASETYDDGPDHLLSEGNIRSGMPPQSFAWQIGEDEDGEPIYANWWDTGTCGCENAEALGEIVAQEARTVEEGMK